MGTRQAAGECPREVSDRAARWGVPQAWTEKYWPRFAQHFNPATVPYAMAIFNVVGNDQPLTVRGAMYRSLSRGVYSSTALASYRHCGRLVLLMRRAGILPYAWISDSTRRSIKPSSWEGPQGFVESMVEHYRKDLWARQADFIEIFCEKDALAGVVAPVTDEYDVSLNVIRGNCSETFADVVAARWKRIEKPIYVYYLGDHDPQGLDIERDLRTRVVAMSGREDVQWERLAVTDEEFLAGRYVTFPIKGTKKARATKVWQTKHADYLQRFGDRCAEVDAVPATELRERLRQAIEGHIDQAEWRRLKANEALEKETLRSLVLGRLFDEGFDSSRDPEVPWLDDGDDADDADDGDGCEGEAASAMGARYPNDVFRILFGDDERQSAPTGQTGGDQ